MSGPPEGSPDEAQDANRAHSDDRQPTSEDLSGEDLSGKDLSGEDLRGKNLKNTVFNDAELEDVDLRGATLDGTQFNGANLKNADLRGVTMDNVRLVNADLHDARLRDAIINDSQCVDAAFIDATMRGIQFQNTNCTKATFDGARAPDAEFRETRLLDADLENVSLPETTFEESNLAEANFEESNLRDASLKEGTEAVNADFEGANLSRIKCTGCDFRLADFTDATLTHASLIDSEFDSAQFIRAEPNFAEFESASAQSARFHDSDLHGAEFRATNLQNARFNPNEEITHFEDGLLEQVDIRGADFRDTAMYQTILNDVRLNDNTKFTEGPDHECVYEQLSDENTDGLPREDGIGRDEAAMNCYRHLESVHRANDLSNLEQTYHINKKKAERENAARSWYRLKRLTLLESYLTLTVSEAFTNYGESLNRLIGWWILLPLLFVPGYMISGVTIGGETCSVLAPLLAGLNCSDWVAMTPEAVRVSYLTFVTIGISSAAVPTPTTEMLRVYEALFGVLLLALFVFVLSRRTER